MGNALGIHGAEAAPTFRKSRIRRGFENPIDAFVLAKLDQMGWKPSAEADRAKLLRRVTFDLTGLPPTPEEVDAFLADHSPGCL